MIVGLLADVHGNYYGLSAALAALRAQGAELILCAGDIVGYYPFVNEAIGLLREAEVQCVMGNHDAILAGQLAADETRWQEYHLHEAAGAISATNLEWLRGLPTSRCLTIDGIAVAMYHGSPWSPLAEYIYPDRGALERFAGLPADVVVLGHTHWPMVRRAGRVLVANPGSCGQPRDYQPGACYGLLDTATRQMGICREAYDLHKVADAVSDPRLIDVLFRTRAPRKQEG